MNILELTQKAQPLRGKKCEIITIYDSSYIGILTRIEINRVTSAVRLTMLIDNKEKCFFFNKIKSINPITE